MVPLPKSVTGAEITWATTFPVVPKMISPPLLKLIVLPPIVVVLLDPINKAPSVIGVEMLIAPVRLVFEKNAVSVMERSPGYDAPTLQFAVVVQFLSLPPLFQL